ncbi:cellular tumor antigen p53 [Leptopilina heterotoma]|uniref:cellular tumor antigen p53 n=1 Tax=Leptopilina heterotoma TaxID=63436 RepID=UPI001CA81E32|nr:cellular tumor antigen p53 [Leptopilina heterotoma]
MHPGGNVLSDSQESILFDNTLMEHIKNDLVPDGIEVDQLTNAIFEDNDKKYLSHYQGQPIQQPYNMYAMTMVAPRDEFPGQFDFQLMLNQQASSKHWIYSQSLAKVFINMDEVLPLRFKWEPPVNGLFLRTQMVYVLEQYRSDPVLRCHNHMAMPCKSNFDSHHVTNRHVFRCVDRNSTYEETQSGHLTIRTPLGTPDIGTMYVPVHFKFLCKNSCTSGMNRRATEMIFTLEDEHQTVLGRRRLQVRICSCPKRDKEKEEAEATGIAPQKIKKRKITKAEAAQSTAIKRCASFGDDTTVCHLDMDILGKEEAKAVKKFAYDIMAGKAIRTGKLDLYMPYLSKLSKPPL